MKKFIFILLLPLILLSQGPPPPDPNLKIQTMYALYELANSGDFTAKSVIPQTTEAATVLDAKNYLFLEEGPEYPIYPMLNNRLVPRYALVAKPPIPVLTLTGTAANSLTFSFTDPIGGATSSTLRYIPDFEYGTYWISNTAQPTPPRTVSGLLPTTTYYVQIQLIYPNNIYGEWSNVVIATTGGSTDNYPSSPYLSGYSTGTTTGTLNWTAATDDIGLTGYRINRWTMVLGLPVDLWQTTVAGFSTSYMASGLLAGVTYKWIVEAIDTGNHYTASNHIYFTTTNTSGGGGIGTPILTASTNEVGDCGYYPPGGNYINIAWSAPSGAVIDGYKLYYRNTTLNGSWHYIKVSSTTTHFQFFSQASFSYADNFEFYVIPYNSIGTVWNASNVENETTCPGTYVIGTTTTRQYVVTQGSNIVITATFSPVLDWRYSLVTAEGESAVETSTTLTINNIRRPKTVEAAQVLVNGYHSAYFTVVTVDPSYPVTRENPYAGNSDN